MPTLLQPKSLGRQSCGSGFLGRLGVAETFDLNKSLTADRPPQGHGRVIAQHLDASDALSPQHATASTGKTQNFGKKRTDFGMSELQKTNQRDLRRGHRSGSAAKFTRERLCGHATHGDGITNRVTATRIHRAQYARTHFACRE